MLNPLSDAFGLDIGDKSLKLAQMKRNGNRDRFRLSALGSIEIPDGVMDRGRIVDPNKMADLVRKLMRSCVGRPKGRGVVACLPEIKTFIKIIDAPEENRGRDSLNRAVMKEIEQNIPLSKDEIYFDWQLIVPDRTEPREAAAKPQDELLPAADADDRADETKRGKGEQEKKRIEDDRQETEGTEHKILLGAAPKQLVDECSAMLELAGLAPIAFEIEATAIARCIAPKFDGLGDAIGILDIGATRSSLVIYDRGLIQMSISIPISGDSITQTISESLKVSWEDAELLKKECGLDATRCENKVWNIILPLIDDMTQKIKNAVRFYRIGFPYGRDIERLFLCGGGAHFRHIDAVLSKKLTIKVERGDATVNLQHPIPKRFRKQDSLAYTTAIGLAMRAAEETRGHLSILR